MILEKLIVVLNKPRFPENVGMAARACANMGCPNLALVAPERWNFAKAEPPATPKGLPVLKNAAIYSDLREALNGVHFVLATSARAGGWRKNVVSPTTAAEIVVSRSDAGERIALVFGPEDKGLTNEELALCGPVVRVPTDGASSLNLAQCVLILLYECARIMKPVKTSPPETIAREELYRLQNELKNALISLDCLNEKNGDYFFIQWRNILEKARLKRHEYDAFMGLCRQIKHKTGK